MKRIFLVNDPNDYLALVNKNYKLSNNYIPNDLEIINKKYSYKTKYLRKKARISFENMAKEIEKIGLKIVLVSAYRNYEYQDRLFKKYVKDKGLEYASMCSAQAGHSEHQLGLAIDIADKTLDYDSFAETKEFNWIKANAYKYGFILRYPKDKVNITKYKYEPWHYRYVGNIAKYLYENNLTLEEYKKTNPFLN